ncbi:MAG: hypothetical protein RIR00_2050 [Pseudomonadota bacterium]|jgi:hypothetical protein
MNENVKSKRKLKYPGLRPIAAELGITFHHLWKMLEGQRTDPRGHCANYWRLVRERYPEQHAQERHAG